ncbi:hypothetical protein ACFSQJ_15045 [Croceitalea marina]|uniref:Outer membrane protein beta-barrel domain-containing protein n=1 Tax=Croceitalea marina TaxID=1775166 RepID=A0ABW5N0J0_9FLAO
MRKTLLLLLFMHTANFMSAQKETSTSDIEGFSYPTFSNGERYSNFSVTHLINTNLEVEIRGFYQRNVLGERFRAPLLLKKYLSDEKTYLIGGAQAEWEFLPRGIKPPRVDIIMGAGHQFNENLSIEGIFQLPVMNSSSVNPLGSEKPGTSFLNLGSKFRF